MQRRRIRFTMKATTQSGFSLIELTFVVVIAGLLLSIGIPNFRDFIRNSRNAAESNDLLTGINVARSEAVKRRAPVTMCSGIPPACDPGDFSDGWFVFVDTDGNGTRALSEEILRAHEPMADSIATRVVGTTDDEGDDSPEYDTDEDGYLSFGQNGFRRMGDGTLPAAVAIVLCDERGNVPSSSGQDVSTARAIEVSTAGRAAISRDRDRIEILGGCP